MAARNRLRIQVAQSAVGELFRASHPGDSVFGYHAGVPAEAAVSLLMPIQPEQYPWERGLHPIFQQNLPEGALRAELTNRFSKVIAGFDDFALLEIVGPYQLGRVMVEGAADREPMPGASLKDLLVEDSAKDLFEDLVATYARYSGISGVQPKVLVRDADTPFDRLTHRGATHIVKAWNPDEYPELAANEFFCLEAARLAGIEVPGYQLSANRKFLVVERFDHVAGQYLGFEDFATLNGWAPSRKYDGSYEGIARQIRALASPEHVAGSLEQFFASVLLSMGIRNGDDHLKNRGLLYDHCGDDASIRLAPAFDIVNTTSYVPRDVPALHLGGSKAWPKFKVLRQFGRVACGLTEARVAELFERVLAGMSQARASAVSFAAEQAGFEPVATRMLAAWEEGTARSLLDPARPVRVDMAASGADRADGEA